MSHSGDPTVSLETVGFRPAQPVVHERLGRGVVLDTVQDGFARVFFQDSGEQVVAAGSLAPQESWDEQVVNALQPADSQALKRLQLAVLAIELPLLENAASLTAAKVDLLPHQLVLTHRVAEASPRRFLVADDVGLGKTIETALILRELASRGELARALMVVPAGLVENWRRELNDVFHLDFEVFGSGGDVTDRKTNSFVKHHRLIASIDTLKRPRRLERLAEAPAWDLVVFDEAHHLTATRSGNSVKKTDNYRLAEALRDHCRDLLLLSATPHQGDHFRFQMLIRLLHPSLFRDAEDMLANRHRLNAVMFRRTKADACRPDGSPLFARRQVHTQAFVLSDEERRFYSALTDYLQDGYDLSAAQGGKARAIGFVMTVFQKIASSSFAAVKTTLERRLVSLTLHEAIAREANMDVSGRDLLLREARQLLIEQHGLADDWVGRAEADRLIAYARVKLIRKLKIEMAEEADESEIASAGLEETAAQLVEYALPEERQRIRELLQLTPAGVETKTVELLRALGQLWMENPQEKVIIFTTYLGGVDALRKAIADHFGEVGVEVLKGGDQNAKLAAERRFSRPTGPRVLISTAAGREGINLQFARVLFNHDLPWNPMDLEQRIGRIHRYGQHDTAQVYNLVAADTIEGRVYLLLETKIRGVAAALGKVDDRGEVAEDLRGQILGQLGERLSFSQLYRDALQDPTLTRTTQELEVALANANQARNVVGQLFQDLEPFRLDQYQAVDTASDLQRLRTFVSESVETRGGRVLPLSDTRFAVELPEHDRVVLTMDRDEAMGEEQLGLLGLEHPLVQGLLAEARNLGARGRALLVDALEPRMLSVCEIKIKSPDGGSVTRLCQVRMDASGNVLCSTFDQESIQYVGPVSVAVQLPSDGWDRHQVVIEWMPAAIRSYLRQTGILEGNASYSARLLAWLEQMPSVPLATFSN